MNSKKIQKELPRIDEIPFDSIRKMMTTIHKIPHIKQEKIAYTKGAFDMMLPKIKFILDGQNIRKITKKDIEILKATNTQMA
ncbi:MAG: hypothetical protein LBQ24_04790 [Candidatus Peribacteria bacterium]|nr:hypothetical protein [Candidatus Peribacteria bacterium]